jgi:hypothetical protein
MPGVPFLGISRNFRVIWVYLDSAAAERASGLGTHWSVPGASVPRLVGTHGVQEAKNAPGIRREYSIRVGEAHSGCGAAARCAEMAERSQGTE